jgi:hypothetical protein
MIEFVDQNTSLAPMPSTTLEIVQLRTQNTMTLRRKNLVMVDAILCEHIARGKNLGATPASLLVIGIVRGRIPINTNSYVDISLPEDIP